MNEFLREELERLQERALNLDRGQEEIVEAICLLAEVIDDAAARIINRRGDT